MSLGYITLSICIENPNSYNLIVIFSIIFLFLIICISLYDKFLAVIEENTNYRFKLELDKMEQEYSAKLDDKLNQLHSLRHDMKNHLIVIDGYASQHNDKKIHEYIHNISYHCAVKHNHQLLSDGFSYHVLKNGADLIYRRAWQNIPVPFYQVPV